MTDPLRLPAPLFWLAGGLLGGQVVAVWLGGAEWRWLGGAAALSLLVALRRWRLVRAYGVVVAALGMAVLGHWQLDGVLRPALGPDHVQRFGAGRAFARGRVVERPVQRPTSTRLLVELTAARRGSAWQPITGRVWVTVRHATHRWQPGDTLEGLLALRQPRNFGNPGEFDYEGYLARRGVYVTAFAAADRDWQRTPARLGVFDRWRDAVVERIARTLDPPAAAIVGALLVGRAIAIPDALRERFARAGVSHVLAISGLHVGLVASAAFLAWRWLLARSEWLLIEASVPKLALLGSVVPVAGYAAIAGDNLATLRAEAMGGLLIAAVLLDRPRDWLASITAAAAAINAARPGAFLEISFQLSFVAVGSIVLGLRRLRPWWDAWEEERLIRLRGGAWRWLRWLVLSEAVTLSAMAGTAPLTAWHFNQISLIALVANPLVVPLLGVCVGVGLLATATVPIAPSLAGGLFVLAGIGADLVDLVVRACAALPGASVQVVTPSWVELVAIYGALAALLMPAGARRRALLVTCVVVLTGDVAYWTLRRTAASDLTVTFVSVGHGDCAVAELPGGRVVVVDGGGLSGHFDVGRQVVAPLLWRRKIRRIDLLVLTHPDFDHYGGLTFLAGAFSPRELWWNGDVGRGPRFAALQQAVRDSGAVVRVVGRGIERTVGGVAVRVLHPGSEHASENDRSLTLQLRYGPTTVLLPGDVEAAGERALVYAAGPTLRSTVLKVPHHGSRTSSTAALLDAVAPRFAVLSAGAANRYGLPHPEVVAAYEQRGIALFRTDRDGAVALRIGADGTIAVRTGRPP